MIGMLLALLGCTPDPDSATLSQNVGDAFAPCNEAEIKYLANKHNFMTAFRPCGNNHFDDFAWSPDGRKLYFQLGTTHYLMDAASPNRDTRPVPTPAPVGPAAWLSATRLVVPIDAATEGAGLQLALYDVDQASVFTVGMPPAHRALEDLTAAGSNAELIYTAEVEGRRAAFRIDLTDGRVAPAFPWLTELTTLTYTPAQQLVVIGHQGTVTVHDAATGASQGAWSPASRGVVHPEGRWLMLEHEGAPQSVFYQRAWDELPEKARARELERARRFEERLPRSFEREVRPPTLSFADLTTGARWRLDSVLGKDFEWYTPTPFYGSFTLWGFEGKQFKRNVLLGDFTSRMMAAAAGSTFMGMHAFGEADGARYTRPPVTDG